MPDMSTLRHFIGTLLLLPVLAPPLAAENVAYLIGADTLFLIALDTNASERVGAIDHPVTALAGDPNGALFAADSENDRLLQLDRDTGTGSIVGSFGRDLEVVDLAFDDAGRLWAMSCPVLNLDCLPHLIEIAPDTGAVLGVGPAIELPYSAGLAWIGGQFYVAGTGLILGRLDPVTGAITPLRSEAEACSVTRGASGSPDGSVWVFSFNPCGTAPFEIWSISHFDASNGDLIGQVNDGGNAGFPLFGVGSPAIVPARPTNVPLPLLDVQQPAYADRPLVIDVTYQQNWCFVGAQTTVADRQIDIVAQEACACLGSPNPTTFRTEVGPVPIGRYRVNLSRQGLGPVGIPCEEIEPLATVRTGVVTETDISQILAQPFNPTVEDDVSLVVASDCYTRVALESVVDRVVWLRSYVDINPTDPCFPIPFSTVVPLGALPAGDHTVIVRARDEEGGGFEGLSRFVIGDLGTTAIELAERFRVEVTWTRPDGSSGAGRGRLLPDSDRGAEFWFFRPSNPELLVKLLDGCSNNGHRWFFAGGLTNLGVEITVTDQVTDEAVVYRNPLGDRFEPVQDTRAFVCE